LLFFRNQREGEFMEILVQAIVGWFGSVWWYGIEFDAPPPGGGDPWWWGILGGLAGAVSAIVIARLVPGMDAMVGLIVMIAAGRVGSGIVGAVLRSARK
jgi:hypothetical protein